MKYLPPSPARLAALAILMLLLLGAVQPCPVGAEETFNAERPRSPRENYLSLIFGSPPPMATERGILLIDAYFDRNDNGRRDPGENDLAGEVTCTLDGIDYSVPAFIPGLKYEGNYQLACNGPHYALDLKQPELFISQRGAILRVDIPCRVLGSIDRPSQTTKSPPLPHPVN